MSEKKSLVLHTDGGARGNPGPAGIGVAIYDTDQQLVATCSDYIGEATNNQAEYKALIAGLDKAADLKGQELNCYLDSELVVRQLNGQYRVKDTQLAELLGEVLKKAKNFKSVSYHHVPREKNKKADQLVNLAIDKAIKDRRA